MPVTDALLEFAANVRADRRANPALAGDGTGLELLIAPHFQAFLQRIVPEISQLPLRVLPEYRRAGLGRPDIAFALPASPARAFIELKEPNKGIEEEELRGHDLDQFRRFKELPLWGLTNFSTIKLFRRDAFVSRATIAPVAALSPETSDAEAEAIIREQGTEALNQILQLLVSAEQPSPRTPLEAAQVLAYAARLVREVVLAQCREGLDQASANVRGDFNETLFSRAEAGGYDVRDMDQLFSGAFAQTLVFGLLLARDAGGGGDIDHEAYQRLPEATYPLLRGTLRALMLDEVRNMLGVAFDIAVDAVNSINPELMEPRNGRDPMLYLYEDFLRVFDQAAVAKYGVYYTPPEIVKLMVSETDHVLRTVLRTDGLLDENVQLLDPACGTGTFLIGVSEKAAELAISQYGPGMVGPAISALARRMHGFELLVGPYTVAHYRMAREVLNRGGGVEHIPIYLTDTLAPPAGAAGVNTHLGFLSAPMVREREAADQVKANSPILAIIGNPPYKRLKSGEVERLVGRTMNEMWDDLKQPVRQAGLGLSLNAFPDLCIAFYRWALWRLFEAEGAVGRGSIAYITNRTFLTSAGYGGLRQMLRERFDSIHVIDFRGNNRGALPATLERDENVFSIEVGVCILVAAARGVERDQHRPATVSYADVWRERAFRRSEKLLLAETASTIRGSFRFEEVAGDGMSRFKPAGFLNYNWPSIAEVFSYKSNGIVTYRDPFVYATARDALSERILAWHELPIATATTAFKNSASNTAARAIAIPFTPDAIEEISYRSFDRRFLYNSPAFVDRQRGDLAAAWGAENYALMSLPGSTGEGPAVWSHGLKPDQHAFRGSYGGWIYPLFNHAEAGAHFVDQRVIAGLSVAYGRPVEPQEIYDAVLALLSATTYTTRFAHDLEDDHPDVPFPAERGCFERAAAIGSRIRTLQGFRRLPDEQYRTATLEGDARGRPLDVPSPAQAFVPGEESRGSVLLVRDGDFSIANVSVRAWIYAVSGYRPLYKWLKARQGESMHGPSGVALLRGALETVWRLEELVALSDEADVVLDDAVALTLTREELNMPRRLVDALDVEGDDGAD